MIGNGVDTTGGVGIDKRAVVLEGVAWQNVNAGAVTMCGMFLREPAVSLALDVCGC